MRSLPTANAVVDVYGAIALRLVDIGQLAGHNSSKGSIEGGPDGLAYHGSVCGVGLTGNWRVGNAIPVLVSPGSCASGR